MNVKELEEQLHAEGFRRTFVWQDPPNATYPDHKHAGETAHYILDGELALTSEGKTATYKKGERVDVPANTVHSAKIGAKGCRYLIGEK